MVVNVYIEPVIEIETKKRGERHVYRANSYTTNFIRMLYAALAAGSCPSVQLTKTDGSPHAPSLCTTRGDTSCSFGILDGRAGVGDTSFGILVGSDTTPFSFDQYKLYAQYPSSILRPYETRYEGVTGSGNISTLSFSRIFENIYSTATVAEVGYASYFLQGIVLSLRDVITPITLSKGDAIIVRYKLSFQA